MDYFVFKEKKGYILLFYKYSYEFYKQIYQVLINFASQKVSNWY